MDDDLGSMFAENSVKARAEEGEDLFGEIMTGGGSTKLGDGPLVQGGEHRDRENNDDDDDDGDDDDGGKLLTRGTTTTTTTTAADYKY